LMLDDRNRLEILVSMAGNCVILLLEA